MTRPDSVTRRLRIGLVALTFALSALLMPSAGALAGFGTSPGVPGSVARCASGTHIPEAALLARTAAKEHLEYR